MAMCVMCACIHGIAHDQFCSRPRVVVIIFLVHCQLTTDTKIGDKGGIDSRTRGIMATIGQLEAFKPDEEKISVYLERVQPSFKRQWIASYKGCSMSYATLTTSW